jgi:DNA-binding NtrC family response regulator
MVRSSASGWVIEKGFLAVQQVNGFHKQVESQSNIHSNGAGPDHTPALPPLTRPEAFSKIVHASRAMREILVKIERSSGSSAPMLITGETGTGKELIARAVHAVSLLSDREFIPFDCGGAPTELIASELFGYWRGAFTGADRDYIGVIREADGCTLFLDEIGEAPLEVQAKLLRFLQEGEVRPLRQTRPIKVNVRVIAATNRDIRAEIRAERFREDLFHRLNPLWLRIPPLRERREDIPLLIEHFLGLALEKTGKEEVCLNDEARALMFGHDWSGNARELDNLIHRMVAFAENGDVIGPKRFLVEAGICDPSTTAAMVDGKFVIDPILPYPERQNELERLSIIDALNQTGGNITHAAIIMGICRNYLKKRIKGFGIEMENHNQPQPNE